MEDPSGKFREHQISSQSGLRRLRIYLWHADINPQLVRLDYMKKLSPSPSAASRINQCANIGVSCRNHAIKGSVDLLESLQFFQTSYVGLRRLDRGLLGCKVSCGIIRFLF